MRKLSVCVALVLAGCSGDAEGDADFPPGFESAGPNDLETSPADSQSSPNAQDSATGGTNGTADNSGTNEGAPNYVRTEGLGNGDSTTETNQQDNSQTNTQGPLVGTFGDAVMTGNGESTNRFQKADVQRNGQNYFFMANGWGPNFDRHAVSWSGTSFTVDSMLGAQGDQYEPASYPTMFCGQYSDSVSGECGLPTTLASLSSLRTGWSWRANGNDGQYNAAYDIWLGNGPNVDDFSGFLMVWYREPVGQQPAGRLRDQGVTVEGVSGTWNIWEGTVFVNGKDNPIINWVRAEGNDTPEMEFDVLDFVRDAQARNYQIPGSHVLSVAVGFEIWNGPITNLQSLDFYVDPQ